ncbi:tail sheath protein [Anaerobacterium chartisolvens]|uniref:Tail sheath protein n=1 Tax=Anaerobacterium chartisolvens TaxID=1297424 RepID=A0A369AVN3_9FIRM|nr:phage tail sheath subtilisin-like domain-containing protein [Anaerobacterium chartisolvens]RCX13261.1 tail sheath protein [Anaerobacterium chartisolvens]
MSLGLPQILVTFKSKASSIITRGSRGIVALVLKDASVSAVSVVEAGDASAIPATLSESNRDIAGKAFIGGAKPPKKLILVVIPDNSTDYTGALSALETRRFDYLAVPGIDAAGAAVVAGWVKDLRDEKDIKVKAVLPDTAADSEGIINFATGNIEVGAKTYSASMYTARIAGLLAGTPLNISATFWPLPEVTDIPRLTKSQYDEAIGVGKLVLYHDGEKVKIARAVNSLVTTTSDKGEDFKKIKMVDIMDMRHDDIKKTVEDSYIGKYPNSYDNKLLLVNAIKAYDEGMANDGLLDPAFNNETGIDMQAQKEYLEGIGVNTSDMSDQQIKEANTHDRVFLQSNIKILDAIEDFTLTTII